MENHDYINFESIPEPSIMELEVLHKRIADIVQQYQLNITNIKYFERCIHLEDLYWLIDHNDTALSNLNNNVIELQIAGTETDKRTCLTVLTIKSNLQGKYQVGINSKVKQDYEFRRRTIK